VLRVSHKEPSVGRLFVADLHRRGINLDRLEIRRAVKVEGVRLVHQNGDGGERERSGGEHDVPRLVTLVVVLLPGPRRHREVIEGGVMLLHRLREGLAVVVVPVARHAPHHLSRLDDTGKRPSNAKRIHFSVELRIKACAAQFFRLLVLNPGAYGI